MRANPRDRMVLAALDLLRRSGLSGAGINSVVQASGAPKGSVYHYFPRGKDELVMAALREAERLVGAGLSRIFEAAEPVGDKVRALFSATGAAMQAKEFSRACPVAAVTLDLESDADEVREVCAAVFDSWQGMVAGGLREVPAGQRRDTAALILATLEGAMILARASATKEPLQRAGDMLAAALAARFPSPRPARRRPR